MQTSTDCIVKGRSRSGGLGTSSDPEGIEIPPVSPESVPCQRITLPIIKY